MPEVTTVRELRQLVEEDLLLLRPCFCPGTHMLRMSDGHADIFMNWDGWDMIQKLKEKNEREQLKGRWGEECDPTYSS